VLESYDVMLREAGLTEIQPLTYIIRPKGDTLKLAKAIIYTTALFGLVHDRVISLLSLWRSIADW
jgi:hypothetical protein